MEELATRARQLVAMGQLQSAKEHWQAILHLLPPTANEYTAVQREIAQLDARLNPKEKTDWKKRLGPLGALIAFIAKFKAVIFTLLLKGKVLFSLLAFFGVYWALFGWRFAAGMVASIFIHEMGHYVMVRRFGFQAELPMFIPGFGAYVKWNGAGVDVATRSLISLAGPFFGLLSGLLSYALFLSTHEGVWLAVAHFAGWLNLLNLIPVFIFDGRSGMAALGRQERFGVLVVCIALFALLHDILFLGVAAGTAYRIWRPDYPPEPSRRIGIYFAALVIGNGFLSWFSIVQAGQLFPH